MNSHKADREKSATCAGVAATLTNQPKNWELRGLQHRHPQLRLRPWHSVPLLIRKIPNRQSPSSLVHSEEICSYEHKFTCIDPLQPPASHVPANDLIPPPVQFEDAPSVCPSPSPASPSLTSTTPASAPSSTSTPTPA